MSASKEFTLREGHELQAMAYACGLMIGPLAVSLADLCIWWGVLACVAPPALVWVSFVLVSRAIKRSRG